MLGHNKTISALLLLKNVDTIANALRDMAARTQKTLLFI
jgi:hypothetical protein